VTAKKSDASSGNRRARLIRVTISIGAIPVAVLIIVVVTVLIHAHALAFDYSKFPMLGNSRAPVKIVEFADFKCPPCKEFHDRIFPLLKSQYIDTDIVRFYFANFPIVGPDSTTAAIAGEAIFHQNPGAFWDYYNAVYHNQGDYHEEWATPDFLVNLAHAFVPGIDYQKLAEDIARNAYESAKSADHSAGIRAGVRATPTFFINGHVFLDFSDWEALKAAISKFQ